MEAQKLKLSKKLKEVDTDKLVNLMTYLEGVISVVLNEEGNLEIFIENKVNIIIF